VPDATNEAWNCAYFPVVFMTETQCLGVKAELEKAEIFPRRYFYPSLNTINDWGAVECAQSEGVAQRILCLPLFHSLSFDEVKFIVRLLKRKLRYGS